MLYKISKPVLQFSLNTAKIGVEHQLINTNKSDYHDITEILLKVALNTIPPN
jgi:hypothetical protein